MLIKRECSSGSNRPENMQKGFAPTMLRVARLAPIEGNGWPFYELAPPTGVQTSQHVDPVHLVKRESPPLPSPAPRRLEGWGVQLPFQKTIPCKVHTPCPRTFYEPDLVMWPQLQGGPGGWESPAGVSAWRASCPGRGGKSFLLLQPLAPSRQRCSQEQVSDSMAVHLHRLPTQQGFHITQFLSLFDSYNSPDLRSGAGETNAGPASNCYFFYT